jgi:hypothetical protein
MPGAHPRLAFAITSPRRAFAGETISSREAYAEAKTAFVTRVTESALAEGYPHAI